MLRQTQSCKYCGFDYNSSVPQDSKYLRYSIKKNRPTHSGVGTVYKTYLFCPGCQKTRFLISQSFVPNSNILESVSDYIESKNIVELQRLFKKQTFNAEELSSWKNSKGNTLLMTAIINSFFDAIKLLMEKGVDPNICSQNGKTPIAVCCLNVDPHAANLLLSGSVPLQIDETHLQELSRDTVMELWLFNYTTSSRYFFYSFYKYPLQVSSQISITGIFPNELPEIRISDIKCYIHEISRMYQNTCVLFALPKNVTPGTKHEIVLTWYSNKTVLKVKPVTVSLLEASAYSKPTNFHHFQQEILLLE